MFTAAPTVDCYYQKQPEYQAIQRQDALNAVDSTGTAKDDFVLIDNDFAELQARMEAAQHESERSLPSPGVTAIRFDNHVFVRITENLSLKYYGSYLNIPEWDLQFPISELKNLDQVLWRHFNFLFGKAQNQTLTATQKVTWLKILKTIDYASFRNELAPALYEEGIVKNVNPRTITIQWRFGKTEMIPIDKSSCLKNLHHRDCFSARVRRGPGKIILSLECIMLQEQFDDAKTFNLSTVKTF